MPRQTESLVYLRKPPSHHLRSLLSAERIRRRVEELGEEIRRDYHDRNPLFVCVLRGAFMFAADLVRAANIQGEMDFVRLRSYHSGTESSGVVELTLDCESAIEGRDVIVVDDIVDTGITIAFLLNHLRRQEPRSLRLCGLLDKISRRRTSLDLDYVGFAIPDVFVVGYGMDLGEEYRCLPDVRAVVFEEGEKQEGG